MNELRQFFELMNVGPVGALILAGGGYVMLKVARLVFEIERRLYVVELRMGLRARPHGGD